MSSGFEAREVAFRKKRDLSFCHVYYAAVASVAGSSKRVYDLSGTQH